MKGSGSWAIEGLSGGVFLAARANGFVLFWDWETGEIVRRIEVDATNVYWSGSGSFVIITTKDSFYVVRFDQEAYNARVESGTEIGDEGVEEAFEVIADINESVKTAKWIEDCFVYTTANNRLNYLVGSESYTVTNLESPMYLLGFIPQNNKVYLADKDVNVHVYSLSLNLIEYQTAILREDTETAASILPSIPKEQLNKVARFLEARGLKQLALEVSQDQDHKFDLAISLDDLQTALAITEAIPQGEADAKWKVLGDRALVLWQFDLARRCFENSNDLSSLMLLLLSMGDKPGLERLANSAVAKGQNNLAFAALLQLGNPQACVDLLLKTGRPSEAALFARTYAPSQVPKAVKAWKSDLESHGKGKLALQIASPEEHEDMFGAGWQESLSWEAAASKAIPNGVSS